MTQIFLLLLIKIVALPCLAAEAQDPMLWFYGTPKSSVSKSSQAPVESSLILGFKSDATTQNDRIYLDDIASCIGDVDTCREIKSVDLFQSPPPSHESRYSVNRIKKILSEEFPNKKIFFEGAESVLIKAIGVDVQEESVRFPLNSVWRNLDSGPIRFVIVNMKYSKIVKLRNENYDFSFPDILEAWGRLKDTPRRTSVTLKVLANPYGGSNIEKQIFSVNLQVRAEIRATVATVPLDKGVTLMPSDFELKWVPYQDNLIVALSEVESKKLRTYLRAGAALKNYDLVRDPDIRRGETIDALISKGNVKMNISGQALESGVIGQKIRVHLDSSKRPVFGKIVAKSKIEVDLP